MSLVQGHGFVTLAVTNLERAVDFYTRVCRLAVTESRDDEAFLSGDARHHWLRLQRREQAGLVRLGYEAASAAAVEEVSRRLEKSGVAWMPGGSIADDRVRGGIRFRDPFGIEVELYEEMLELGQAPVVDGGLAELLHAVVFVPDVNAARDFYVENLELRRSDQIEDVVVFLRGGNRYHHALALARGESGRLDHFAILVDDLDDVMRFRAHARVHGVLRDDVVRHAASGSVSVYVHDDDTGVGVEFCTWHMKIDDDSYRGRLLAASRTTVNLWSEPFGAPTDRDGRTGSSGGTAAARVASGEG